MRRSQALRRTARFRLDSALARGASPVVALLGLVTALMIVFCALIVVIGGITDSDGEQQSFFESGWSSLMRALDPGTMGDDRGWALRIVSLIATLGGIFIVSTLIGLITTAIDERLTELRHGRGPVELSGHTVVLGWSQGLEIVLAELAEANANQHRQTVVVLADRDPSEVRPLLKMARQFQKQQRVVYRKGDTADLADLALVSAERARSVIVVHDDGADAEAVRTALAVINGLPAYRGRVIAQIADRDLAAALGEATAGRALAISSRDVISKVSTQVCRFQGMAAVYEELLDFEGDEIYVQHEPQLIGATFAQVVMSYEDSMPIGLQRPDRSIELCPDWNRVVQANEMVVAISRDDDTVVMSHLAEPFPVDEPQPESARLAPNHLLLIGWNEFARDLISTLDAFVPDGSTITVCDPSLDPNSLPTTSHIVDIVVADVDTTKGLRTLANTRHFNSILLLCSRTGTATQDDSRNLLRLVILRRILAESGCASANAAVITELRDVADVEIAGHADEEEFLVSERITSLLLAQLAENPDLRQVFDALFEPSDIDLVMVPGLEIVQRGHCTFGEVVREALPHGLVIGVSTNASGSRLNLRKSELIEICDGTSLVLLRRQRTDPPISPRTPA